MSTLTPVQRTAAPCFAAPRPSLQARQVANKVAFRSQRCAAAAESTTAQASSTSTNKWYACVANAEFMLNDIQNESFAEQLREKTRFFKENDRKSDFFIVCEPEWLDKQHPDKAKMVGRPCVALIGSEEMWIRYMKLRLDRVLFVEVEGTFEEVTKCGAKVPDFKSLDQKPNWVAPYPAYAPGWWDVFMPGKME